jgi:hypothetical protein
VPCGSGGKILPAVRVLFLQSTYSLFSRSSPAKFSTK